MLFLSKKGQEPSDYSLSGLKIEGGKILEKNGNEVAKFKAVSYNKEIMEWLDSCLDEAGNLVNLVAVISQYKNVIEKIYGEYKGVEIDAEEISKIILENYDLVDNIRNRYFDMANIYKINTFMPNVKTELEKMLSQDQWCIEVRDTKTTKRLFSPISFYKYSWDGLINFRLEFDSVNLLNPYIGLAYDTKRIKKEYVDNIQVESLSNEWKVGERFARYKMLDKCQFLREIIINKYTEAELAKEFINMKDELEKLADEIIKLAMV